MRSFLDLKNQNKKNATNLKPHTRVAYSRSESFETQKVENKGKNTTQISSASERKSDKKKILKNLFMHLIPGNIQYNQ